MGNPPVKAHGHLIHQRARLSAQYIFTDYPNFTVAVNVEIIVKLKSLETRRSASELADSALQSVDGLEVKPGRTEATIRIGAGNGPALSFQVRHIPVLSQERARELSLALRAQGSGAGGAGVLIATRQLAGATRTILRSAGVSWVERLTGVCRLVAPGLLVEIGNREDRVRGSGGQIRARLRDRSGWLPEWILDAGPRDRIRLTDIAKQAGISTALASRLFRRLTELNVLEAQGAGPRRCWRLADPGALLDLWSEEERSTPAESTGLYLWSRSTTSLYERLHELTAAGIDWALGGTAAANLWAPTLTAYPDAAVWIPARIPGSEAARALGGEVVEKGANLQLWQTQGDFSLRHARDWGSAAPAATVPSPSALRLVSRPRAYLEALRGTGRSAEVAQNLRERLLAYETSE